MQSPNDPRAEERYVAVTIIYDTWVKRPVYLQANHYIPDATGVGEPTKLTSQMGRVSAFEDTRPFARVQSTWKKLRSNALLSHEDFSELTSSAITQPITTRDWPSLPHALESLSQAIRDSHNIVDREAEWDEDEVLSCCEDTWRRAMEVLMSHAKAVWRDRRIVIKAPTISAGPDGSVDLHWRCEPYSLLLNVPAGADECPSYYGDDRDNPDTNRTSGELKPGSMVDLGMLMWLAHTARVQP